MQEYTARTKIIIHNIFTSPHHNYFTREKFDVGNHPSVPHNATELFTGRGLKNDRFEFSTFPITFFSLEVAEYICDSLGVPLDIILFRRNIIVSGLNLNELIGKRFKIDDVEFEGVSHCPPCIWMNEVIGKNAYKLMKGRGGLRVNVIQSGILKLGETHLKTRSPLNRAPLEALKKPIIP